MGPVMHVNFQFRSGTQLNIHQEYFVSNNSPCQKSLKISQMRLGKKNTKTAKVEIRLQIKDNPLKTNSRSRDYKFAITPQ